MKRKSARLIGQQLGLSAKKVNLLLEKAGFIVNTRPEGLPPVWELTELGKLHGEPSKAKEYSINLWDSDIVDILKQLFKLE